ncbi:MAG: hypothetical protein HRT91_01280 [Piscirickettsiaceae bacterium]|nr:hypothetical protein [Piscirickettsiaceae bacterium]NQZ52571.1 hypothetical protein [Moritella sp.]
MRLTFPLFADGLSEYGSELENVFVTPISLSVPTLHSSSTRTMLKMKGKVALPVLCHQ